MTLTAKMYHGIEIRETGAPDLGETNYVRDPQTKTVTLTHGTGAGQADRQFTDVRTLAASTSESLDLAGALVNALGGTSVFAKVKMLRIKAAEGNTNSVVVGNGSTPFIGPFGSDGSAEIVLPPGAVAQFYNPAGWAVAAGTGDLLKIANGGSGTSVTYEIEIVGTSA